MNVQDKIKFTSELANPEGFCISLRETNANKHFGYALEDVILNETPLAKVHYADLFTYMHRRFGLPNMPGNPYKDLSAPWFLTTPHDDVFLKVSPSVSGVGYCFNPYILVEDEFLSRDKIDESNIPEYIAAYKDTLNDLLRPVCVRDSYINALGKLDYDSPYMEYIEESDEHEGGHVYVVKHAESSGCCDPFRLFGSDDYFDLNIIFDALGAGDAKTGIKQGVKALQEKIIIRISAESEDVVVTILAWLLFLSDEKATLVASQILGLFDKKTSEALHNKATLLAESLKGGSEFDFYRLREESVTKAARLLSIIGFENNLKDTLENAHQNQRYKHYSAELNLILGNLEDSEENQKIIPTVDEDDMFFQNVNKDWLAALDPTNHAALIDWYNKVASTPNGVEYVLHILLDWHERNKKGVCNDAVIS
tara:strand:- start:777 stop:2048 length:1272 start_codon:yes stop_codon:yes gene_type:complete